MDCGPASLKALLEGFGIPVSYGRLREACQTGVDGTSIDTMETTAVALGLEAEQIMIPLDHLLLHESKCLPAIVVVRLSSQATHFVVVWRRHGPWLQVMDPAVGRRWIPIQEFLRDVHLHTQAVPVEAWREWAGGGQFIKGLKARLGALGVRNAAKLVSEALADPGWQKIGAAWNFKSGENGYSLQITAIPLNWDGRFILAMPTESGEPQEPRED